MEDASVSHFKAMPLSTTTRRAAGQRAESAGSEPRRHPLRKIILIVAIGLFVFLAAQSVAIL